MARRCQSHWTLAKLERRRDPPTPKATPTAVPLHTHRIRSTTFTPQHFTPGSLCDSYSPTLPTEARQQDAVFQFNLFSIKRPWGGGKVGCWRLCEAGGWGGDRRWWFTVLKNVRHMLEKCARGFNSSGPAGGRSWESWRAKEGAGKRGVVGGGGSFGVRRDALTFRPEHSRAGREPPRNLTVLSSKPQRAESFSTPASSLARSVPHSLLRSLARRRERSDPQSASIVTSAS